MNKKGVIYKATNIVNGKSYIGQSINFVSRKAGHKKGKGNCWLFYRAIEKYGFDSFEWQIIEENIDEDLLDEKEIYYIEKYNTYAALPNAQGYNLTKGGNHVFGSSGEHHFLNLMSEEKREEWIRSYRIGENNPNFGNGKAISGNNHFLNKMNDLDREEWLKNNLMGENNYQKHMSKQELKDKCWINKLDPKEKEKWKKKISGENNSFHKAYVKNPEKYKGKNHSSFGLVGNKNANSKKYVVTFPNSDEYIIVGINNFCKTCTAYEIKCPGMVRCANNQIDNYKRFKCRHYSDKDVDVKMWDTKFNEKYKSNVYENPHIDKTLYKFYHKDGREIIARKHDMKKQFRCRIHGLINGKIKSCMGWMFKGEIIEN